MAEEKVEETQEKGKGNPLMLIVLILLVVLLAVVGGLAYMLFAKGVFDEKTEEPKKEQVEKKDASEEASEFFKTEIKDLVLNITNAKGREKLMKLSFSIKSVEPSIEMLVGDNKAEIIDAVIAQVSARSSEELLTAAGKELLKEELISEMNILLNEATAANEAIPRNNVKDLFFTTFVIK